MVSAMKTQNVEISFFLWLATCHCKDWIQLYDFPLCVSLSLCLCTAHLSGQLTQFWATFIWKLSPQVFVPPHQPLCWLFFLNFSMFQFILSTFFGCWVSFLTPPGKQCCQAHQIVHLSLMVAHPSVSAVWHNALTFPAFLISLPLFCEPGWCLDDSCNLFLHVNWRKNCVCVYMCAFGYVQVGAV